MTHSPDPTAAHTGPNAPISPAPGGAPPARRNNQAVVILLIIIALLLSTIAGILLLRSEGGSSSASSATAEATPSGSAPNPTRAAAAPSLSPEELKILRDEPKRDPNDARAKGNANAPVVLTVFSDFACPYCTKFAQETGPKLQDLIDNGTLRIEWRDLAQITPSSPLAAQAGIAAANQGRFWEFHDAVYAAADPTDHPKYTPDSLTAFARSAGVPDIERFKADMTADATVQSVSQAKAHAYQIGVKGTPFLMINDTYISGFAPADTVRAAITEQAAK
ncbi:DsbA family protein [Actinomyces sp. zg296]|uniref:DsbA family protein n=1 Tax=Actinomyces sp. zg296 TaxID=2609289 RepID=UPI001357E707|nr:thioredoxin domain-containing protein [Actinomyces sp. zg296]